MFGDILADHEEHVLNVAGSKQIKQFWGQRRAWPVVKGHRDVRSIDMDRIKRNGGRFLRLRATLADRTSLCWRGFRSKPERDAQCGEEKKQQTITRHRRGTRRRG